MTSALHKRKNSGTEAEVASLQTWPRAIPRTEDSFVVTDSAGGPTSPVDTWGFESREQSGVPAC